MTNHVLKSSFDDAVAAKPDDGLLRQWLEQQWLEQQHAVPRITGMHPFVIRSALSGVAWFLAVAWLDFSGGPKVGLAQAVMIGLFVMYLTLFLLTASARLQRASSPRPSARRRN
jgi:hypothetical protein